MSLETKREERVWHIIDKLAAKDKAYIDDVFDILTWAHYGQEVFSQFGYGLAGWVFRQQAGSVRATVKVSEGGIPLVAFQTSANTTGCISAILDRLWDDRVVWQKDKYPWI